MNKKTLFYEVHPKYFKDYTGTGTGDLRGLADKMDYFNFLGVDAIILPDLLATQEIDSEHNYKSISKSVGTINDLERVLSIAKKNKIKVIVDLNIGSISETHSWFKAATEKTSSFEEVVDFRNHKQEELANSQYKYDKKTKSFYIIDNRTQEVSLNWSSDETLRKFLDVVRFWNKLGVAGFAFTNFENINNYSEELMSDLTLRELRRLYTSIKEINDSIIVIGKTDKLIPEAAKEFTEGATKVFDYMQIHTMPLIGSSNKYGADLIGHFSTQKLVKTLRKHVETNNDIITFGSSKIGRITSRWGDEGQYAYEAAKSLGLLLLSTPSSACIYYADELGLKNLSLTHLDDFQDETINERKREMADIGISEKRFMNSQVWQNPINAKSLMPWNTNKNGGFSISEKTITPVSSNYRLINVETQFKDDHSPLNFYKKIIEFTKKGSFATIMEQGSYKIRLQKMGTGVIEVIRKHKTKEVYFLINLTKKEKLISLPKNGGKVLYSSYGYKEYDDLPRTLQPFESIIISKKTDEVIKVEQEKQREEEKIKKTKEIELRKIEAQKTREIELKQREKERANKEKQREAEAKQREAERAKQEAQREKDAVEREKAREKDAIEREKEREKAAIEREKQKIAKTKEIELRKAQREKERLESPEYKAKLKKQKAKAKVRAQKAKEMEKYLEEQEKQQQLQRKEKEKLAKERIAKKQKAKELKTQEREERIAQRELDKQKAAKKRAAEARKAAKEREELNAQRELEKQKAAKKRAAEARKAAKEREELNAQRELEKQEAEKQKAKEAKKREAERAEKQKQREAEAKKREAERVEKQKQREAEAKQREAERAEKQKQREAEAKKREAEKVKKAKAKEQARLKEIQEREEEKIKRKKEAKQKADAAKKEALRIQHESSQRVSKKQKVDVIREVSQNEIKEIQKREQKEKQDFIKAEKNLEKLAKQEAKKIKKELKILRKKDS